jgi:flagellum-specific ATP synthase
MYPAIDILNSVSRVMIDIVSPQHLNNANTFRAILATYEDAKDLIDIGAYKKGSNPRIDEAIRLIDKCHGFIRQDIYDEAVFANTLESMAAAIN